MEHLTLAERQVIYLMQAGGAGVCEIARSIKRSKSTVSRELRRNRLAVQIEARVTPLERAKACHDKAKARQHKRGRVAPVLERRPDIAVRVLKVLEDSHYSPEDIATILSESDLGIVLSGRSIRRWIARYYPHYQKHFPHRGKRPRRHLTPKQSGPKRPEKAPAKRSIHERPESVARREDIGDLELDMIVCRQSTAAILSVTDRKTGHCWLEKVDNLQADTVRRAIIALVFRMPLWVVKTMTFDRGSEFAEFMTFERFFGIITYFCDAYCAWQKGSVENQNKRVRRHIPKGTDLSTISVERLRQIELLLNAKPKPSRHNRSSSDLWLMEIHSARSTLH